MNPLQAFGMLLVVATFLVLAGGGIGAIAALARGRRRTARNLVLVVVVWSALHLGLVAAAGRASRERVLARGEVKRFCGFYLDCHLGVAVAGVRTAAALGAPPATRRARGLYHVITLEVSSDARGATLRPEHLVVRLMDGRGRTLERDLAAERALAAPGTPPPLEAPVSPRGGAYRRTLVFDVPAGMRALRLDVTEGAPEERAVELFLLGDADSVRHPRTMLALDAEGR